MKLENTRLLKGPVPPRRSSQRRVYQEIKKAIVNGTIGFDSRLSEESIAKLFGVSRTPIREAIFQLVQEGLVAKKDNSHFYVRRPSEAELDEMAQVRIVLQNILIDKLIDASDDSVVRELEQNVERSKEYLEADDNENLNYALSDFHKILHYGAKSFWVEKILDGMVDQVLINRAIAMRFHGIRRMLISDHEKIMHAIKQGNRVAAKKRMREHIINTKQKALEALLRDKLQTIIDANIV
jgi:DNA-binding GntR family transcriptional regulator